MSYTASYKVFASEAQNTTDFTFTFPYIKEEHIEVYLDYQKLSQGSGSAQYQVITNVSPKLIRLNTGLASANLRVEVRRNSSLGTPLVDYADGSTLTANDLDTSALQSLYIDQELKDNQGKTVSVDEDTGLPSLGESGTNLRLTNVADPTAAQDAATKNYIDTFTGNIDGRDLSVDGAKLDGIEANATADQTNAEIRAAVEAASDSNVFTDADHTKLNAIEASATADQTDAEIRAAVEAASDSNVFTDADHTKLNAIEASATADQTDAEIRAAVEAANDSNVFTDADHTKLNGIETAATADQTAAEIKTAYESNAQTNPLTDAEKAVIDGVTSNTSELNKLDGYTGSTNDLNIVSGKSFKTSSGTLDTTSDTEIPSSKVIAAHVASSQTAIGGFTTIADEVSFPNTQPATGVVVSINNAAGVVINGSGVSTTGKRLDNTTVTINGFPSSLNGETLAAGVGLIVVSTSTANTYNYHKILTSETDVKQLSDDINDFNSRYRIASSAPGSNNDEGDLYFDTAANKMKVYNGSAWDDVASVGSFFVNTLSSSSGTGGGSAVFATGVYRFTLSNAGTSAQQHIVSVNGVIQKPNSGTSQPSEGFAISGNDIIFSAAPAANSDFFIITCGSSVSIGTPSANSVNSSHIIDGSIVDGDISSSAAISEGKLGIHNAPTTGKYLKYTSNGMEWSDGASEGTDVKSTGESGTTKFLRVDGDGTCSWQVPPDTNTQVGGATGVDFNDNVKSRYGAGYDLSIWSNGSIGIIQGISGGGIHIGDADTEAIIDVEPSQVVFNKNISSQDNDIDIRKSGASKLLWDDSDTAFEFANDVKLTFGGSAGSSGQVLTSGGSGSAPSWTTISAAPEVSLVADGAIAANKPVVVQSNGKIKEVKETISVHGTPTKVPSGSTTSSQYAGRNSYHNANCYVRKHKAIVQVDNNEDSSNYGYIRAGIQAADGTISWGSTINMANGNHRCTYLAVAYDSVNDKIMAVYKDNTFNSSSGNIRADTFSIDGNTLTRLNWSIAIYTPNQYLENFKLEYDKVHERFWLSYKLDFSSANYNGYYLSIVPDYATSASSHTVNTYSSNGQYDHSTSGHVHHDFAINTACDRLVSIYRDKGNNYCYVTASSINSSGDLDHVAVNSALTNGAVEGWCSMTYSPDADKWLATYTANSKIYAQVLTITGSGSSTSISAGTAAIIVNYGTWVNCVYDTAINAFALSYGNGSGHPHLTYATISGTSVSGGNELQLDNDSLQGSIDGQVNNITFDSFRNRVYVHFPKSSYSQYVTVSGGTATTTLSDSFIGFSSAAINDTATGIIAVTGNTNSGQSGLTTGSKHYVQRDGSLGTTADDTTSVEAGIALSSTKLLIKG